MTQDPLALFIPPGYTQIYWRGPEMLPSMRWVLFLHPFALHFPCHTFTVVPLWLMALKHGMAQLTPHCLRRKHRFFSPCRDGIQLWPNYSGLNGYRSVFVIRQIQRYVALTPFVPPFLACGFILVVANGCLHPQIMFTVWGNKADGEELALADYYLYNFGQALSNGHIWLPLSLRNLYIYISGVI